MFEFLSNKFHGLFDRLTGQGALTEHNIEEVTQKIKETLLQADVPYKVVDTFLEQVSKEVIGRKILKTLKPGEQFIKIVHETVVNFLGSSNASLAEFKPGSVLMMMGLQGSGKTTTIAKIAFWLQKHAQKKNKKISILVSSVDFQRPAAQEQLAILAAQVGAEYFQPRSSDPKAAIAEIEAYRKHHKSDLCIVDTAGRMHVDAQLLEELKYIDHYIKPTYTFLVVDAMTGQESLSIAQQFDQAVGFEGAILSKMDSSTRAGAAFAFRYSLNKPIVFLGAGEKYTDLEPFDPERIAQRMLGMGDIQTLLEQAEEKIKKSEQEKLARSLHQGKMTLDDFAQHMDMMKRFGSLSQVVKYIPGLGASLTPEMIQQSEKELKCFRAILHSMTPKERCMPALLNGSRKQRIARGAGVGVQDVNALLDRFEKSQQFVKLFKKFGRLS